MFDTLKDKQIELDLDLRNQTQILHKKCETFVGYE